MGDKMKKNFREQNGVTLVALVITVIVLLILASITMGTLLGRDQTVDKSVESIKNATINQIIQSIKIDINSKQMQENRKITEEELKNILNKYGDISEDMTKLKTKEGYEIEIENIYDINEL